VPLESLLPAVLAVCLAGCGSSPGGAAQAGPKAAELAAALGAKGDSPVDPARLDEITCHGIDEEPSEAACSWFQRRDSGSRRERSAILARDAGAWTLIDGPSDLF
jgi:hypothetical protein